MIRSILHVSALVLVLIPTAAHASIVTFSRAVESNHPVTDEPLTTVYVFVTPEPGESILDVHLGRKQSKGFAKPKFGTKLAKGMVGQIATAQEVQAIDPEAQGFPAGTQLVAAGVGWSTIATPVGASRPKWIHFRADRDIALELGKTTVFKIVAPGHGLSLVASRWVTSSNGLVAVPKSAPAKVDEGQIGGGRGLPGPKTSLGTPPGGPHTGWGGGGGSQG